MLFCWGFEDYEEDAMLNIKNKSNLFLAAFVFAALASFSDFAKADVEIDCSGKEGYQLTICEQQKALAEKNAKSNERAEEKAENKIAKQKTKSVETIKEQQEKYKEANKAYGEANRKVTAAENQVDSLSSELGKQQKAKAEAQKKMNEALARGDTEAAKKARDDMAAADKAANTASEKLDTAKKDLKDAQKASAKAEKASEKASEKAYKAAKKAEEKEYKETVKAAEKAEKNANKDLKKAQKEYDKLQKKCEKNPDECDIDALQAAQTNLDAAKANADAATKNREDVDGTTAAKEAAAKAEEEARQQALYDSMEEEEPYEPEIKCTGEGENQTCVEVICDENGNCSEAPVGTYANSLTSGSDGSDGTGEELDAMGNPVSQQRCAEAKDDIFKYIACKAMTTLADVRVIVYTLAGFGLIAFAFAAIFNKISWKHLANLCIALFILSMMTPFISYFTQDNGAQITYGNYLPAGFTNISGSDVDAAANCDTSKGDVCPDVTVDTSAKDSKWSWKDLKNTVKSGINAAKTAYDTYKTVKNTVETTVDQAKKIGTAIKNSEGGLTGVLDTLGEVATASNTIFNTVQTGAGAVVANTSSIANDVQNAGKSGAELAFDKENQNRINELEKKLAAGNLSPEQQEWAKAELEQRKAAVDSNKVTDFANNQGQKALDKINSVAKTGSTVTNIATKASNAAQQGATIGGGSPMDASKAIAMMAANPQEGENALYTAKALDHFPVVCVPTTCGTGSEVTPYAILTRHAQKTKKSISHKIFPALALLDAKYLKTMPRAGLVNTCVDALAHLLESYLNTNTNELNRIYSREGLRIWASFKDRLMTDTLEDGDYWKMLHASMAAGMAIAHTGTSLPHGMSYPVTYNLGIPHGRAVGMFLGGFVEGYGDGEEALAAVRLLGFETQAEFHRFVTQLWGVVELPMGLLYSGAAMLLEDLAKLKNYPFPITEEDLVDMVN